MKNVRGCTLSKLYECAGSQRKCVFRHIIHYQCVLHLVLFSQNGADINELSDYRDSTLGNIQAMIKNALLNLMKMQSPCVPLPKQKWTFIREALPCSSILQFVRKRKGNKIKKMCLNAAFTKLLFLTIIHRIWSLVLIPVVNIKHV